MMETENDKLFINFEKQSNIIMDEINRFYYNGIFTDVIIVSGQEEFNCHKLILAASSNYFRSMFSSSFRENIDSKVHFDSVSPWSMKCIIDFVYSGVCRLSMSHVQDLLQAAEMLEYPFLVEECSKFMSCNIDINNCFAILNLATIYKLESLVEKVQFYIQKNFTRIGISSVEWLNLEVDVVINCISNPMIEVRSEKNVWHAMMRWLNHDTETRIVFLPNLIRHIKLQQLDSTFLENILKLSIIQKCQKSNQIINEYLWLEDRENNAIIDARPSTLKKPTMVLLGGMENFILKRVDSYNPIKNEWTELAPIPESNLIWFSSSVVNNKIYVTGGIKAGDITDRVYIYDSEWEKWQVCPKMLSPRAKHASASVLSRLVVVGGITTMNPEPYFDDLNFNTKIDMFDPLTDQWTTVGLNKHPRIESSLIAVREQKLMEEIRDSCVANQWSLYEIGGSYENVTENDQIVIYKVNNDFSIEPIEYYIKLPLCIKDAKCVVTEDNNVLYIFWENTGKLAQLNIKTNSLHFLPDYPELKNSRIHCGLCYLSNINSLLVVGGYKRSLDSSLNPISPNMYRFDITGKVWSIVERNKPYLERAIMSSVVVKM